MEPVSDKNNPKGIPGLRWHMPAVLLLTVLVSYFDRMNITYAIAKIGAEYGWTTKEIGNYGGLLMSIFYVGYGLANMLLSPLGARFGPRKSLMFIIVLFSFFTALSAPVAMLFTVFVFVRICLGVAEGIHFPMNNIIIRNWTISSPAWKKRALRPLLSGRAIVHSSARDPIGWPYWPV